MSDATVILAPAVVLVDPQMGENIGAAARVMLNFGLTDLRLVSPRDGWPNDAAETMSAGALPERVRVSVFGSVADAISDLIFVLATTARPRDMEKPVYETSDGISAMLSAGGSVGILFGGERSGLPNDAVARADGILTYPVNADFASLNLAQAVAIFAHAWGEAAVGRPTSFDNQIEAPATRAEFDGMINHLATALDEAGFFHPAHKRDLMVQNLANAFLRGQWTAQEVRTFRGVIKSLSRAPKR